MKTIFFIAALLIPLTQSQEFKSSWKATVAKLSPNQRTQFVLDFKQIILQNYFNLVHTCYQRFKLCSKRLHPKFCISNGETFGFYIWAKKLADSIIKQQGVHCPTSMMLSFYSMRLQWDFNILKNTFYWEIKSINNFFFQFFFGAREKSTCFFCI